jgi:pSer/pThr/pTyr-binding forkhead associated (FHA) protein
MADLILEIVEGDEAGRKIPLGEPLEAGRDPSMPLALKDSEASRRHARLSPEGERALVEDLGSTNGTFVNDQPIEGRRTIVPGDRVRLGLTVLQLRTGEQVARQPSAVMPVPQVTHLTEAVAAPEPAPRFSIDESEPAFVPPEVAGDAQARGDYRAVARLVDARVKQRTYLAVFVLLGAAALAVVLAFGLK